MRLIDAEVLQKHLDDVMHDELCDPDHKKACFAISIYVDGMPTIEAEPVRHGEWTPINLYCNHAREFKCSACGESVYYDHDTRFCEYDFCPNCGAKMDGGDSS